MDAFHTYLVLTFVGETRVLAITPDDELDEEELPGFDAEAQVDFPHMNKLACPIMCFPTPLQACCLPVLT